MGVWNVAFQITCLASANSSSFYTTKQKGRIGRGVEGRHVSFSRFRLGKYVADMPWVRMGGVGQEHMY